jgi:hypothetical protein
MPLTFLRNLGIVSAAGITTTKLGAGAVLQVVQGTTTTTTSQTSITWTDTTLTTSITPSSSNNKILVLVNQPFQTFSPVATGYVGGSIRLVRGATTIYGGVLAYQHYIEVTGGTRVNFYDYRSFIYLDSPSSTSSLTYKTQQRSTDAADQVVSQTGGMQATITLMEIKG